MPATSNRNDETPEGQDSILLSESAPDSISGKTMRKGKRKGRRKSKANHSTNSTNSTNSINSEKGNGYLKVSVPSGKTGAKPKAKAKAKAKAKPKSKVSDNDNANDTKTKKSNAKAKAKVNPKEEDPSSSSSSSSSSDSESNKGVALKNIPKKKKKSKVMRTMYQIKQDAKLRKELKKDDLILKKASTNRFLKCLVADIKLEYGTDLKASSYRCEEEAKEYFRTLSQNVMIEYFDRVSRAAKIEGIQIPQDRHYEFAEEIMNETYNHGK